MLPIRSLHHIAVTTRDAEASATFYCEALGFRRLPRPPFNFRGAWLYGYGFQIHVIEHPSLAPDAAAPIDSRDRHLAFSVESLDAVRDALIARGIEHIERVNAGGVRQIFLHDPDGQTIELAVYGDPTKGYGES
jgi:glyoxylase I family protein